MPTYEYACSNCGHRVEVTRRIDDPPLTKCERCGGPMRRVFHPAGIVFKGSGFYATDSRSSARKKDEKKDEKKDDKKQKAPSGSGESSDSGSGSSDSSQKKTEPKSGDKKPSEGKSST